MSTPSAQLFVKLVIAPLAALAVAREAAVSTVELPPVRPISDFCPECGGPARDWRSWVSFSERCSLDWHHSAPALGSAAYGIAR